MSNMKQKIKSLIFILVLLVGICIVVICLNKKPQATDADTQTTDTTQAIDSKPQAIDSLIPTTSILKGLKKRKFLKFPKRETQNSLKRCAK